MARCIAQLGSPDMRIPIATAWPGLSASTAQPTARSRPPWNINFENPDLERFPALRLAREALEAGEERPPS